MDWPTIRLGGLALILGAQPRQVNERMPCSCGLPRLRSSPPGHSRDATNLAVSDRLCVFRGGTFMRRLLIAVVLSCVIPVTAFCQTPHRVAIRAGKLLDGKIEKPVENALIVIQADRLACVTAD